MRHPDRRRRARQSSRVRQHVAQAEYGDDRHGDTKDKTLKKSGHSHHRDGRKGKVSRVYPIDAMIARQGARARGGEGANQRAAVSMLNAARPCPCKTGVST